MEAQLKNIAILGSTGSIGTQTLDVIRRAPGRFKAQILTARRSVDRLIEQAREFRPALAIIDDATLYPALRDALAPLGIETAAGPAALRDAMSRPDFETAVTATVGYSGLRPTLAAIDAGKNIALANKETLVVAGELVSKHLEASPGSEIVPVDSEHSAIYQSIRGESHGSIDRLIITASGGPFRNTPASELRRMKAADALKHPRWVMGAKITIDSATMVNKAFEIIEARWLFDVAPEQIEAVIHPQSIVHSMVQFTDGAVKAQLGLPDMRLPIAYALSRGERIDIQAPKMSLADYASLTFEKPDTERFPALKLAYEMMKQGGTAPCVFNAANEIAVERFLQGNIGFLDIFDIISATLDEAPFVASPSIDDYESVNSEARSIAAAHASRIASR